MTILTTNKPIPAWYDVSLVEDEALLISINTVVLNAQRKHIRMHAQSLEGIREQCQADVGTFSPFTPFESGPWGFGPVLHPWPSGQAHRTVFRCAFPQICVPSGDPTGRTVSWRSAFETALTLCALLQAIEFPEMETEELEPQLCTVKIFSMGPISNPIFVNVLPALMRWIEVRCPAANDAGSPSPHRLLNGPDERMHRVHQRMWFDPDTIWDKRCFSTVVRRPSFIHLNVPGDACGLDPTSFSFHEGGGYELAPHNVDSPLQQLTLLAGIAALCDMARADLKRPF